MFYLKYSSNGMTLKMEVNDENVYTICPECGREHSVDLFEIFKGGDADFYGTSVYCEACSAKRLGK